jgi:hypothetical protein
VPGLLANGTHQELRRGGELVVTARNETERAHAQRQIPDEHPQVACLTAGLDGFLGQNREHVPMLQQGGDHG